MATFSQAQELFAAADALRSLLEHKSTRLSLATRRVARAVDLAIKDVTEEEKKILRECGAVENGQGGFVPETKTIENADGEEEQVPTGEVLFKEDGDKEEAQRRRGDLYATPIEVETRPLKASLLVSEGAELSGQHALALGDLLVDDFEDKDG